MVNTGEMPRLTPRPSGAEDRIAWRLRWERERRGWSTAEVARRMAAAGTPVSQTAVWKIENGNPRRTISVDEALALAKIFGVRSIEDLTRPPQELVSDRLRQWASDLDSIGADLVNQRERLARGTAEIRADLEALVRYTGQAWPEPFEIEDLLDVLANMQKILAETGDDLRRHVEVTRPGFTGRGWRGAPPTLDGDSADGEH
jgi:transcriptional regulator with XRE-family HTH domain